MIDGNRIKFGYGDILVGVDSMFGGMRFEWIKPPKTIGSSHRSSEPGIQVLKSVEIGVTSVFKLVDGLEGVSEKNPVVECGEYILDFSHFNVESLNVVKKNAKKAMNIGLPLAC